MAKTTGFQRWKARMAVLDAKMNKITPRPETPIFYRKRTPLEQVSEELRLLREEMRWQGYPLGSFDYSKGL